MGIGKSRNTQIDVGGLMNENNSNHQIEQEEVITDIRLEELREVQKTLKEATESLRQATVALNEATNALNSAKANADNIVTCFNKAIVDAQENTKFKVYFDREDMEQMMKISEAALKTDEIMMEQHRTKQLQAIEAHERKVSNILSRNKGVWVSDFWLKVAGIAILAYTLVTFIYVQIVT